MVGGWLFLLGGGSFCKFVWPGREGTKVALPLSYGPEKGHKKYDFRPSMAWKGGIENSMFAHLWPGRVGSKISLSTFHGPEEGGRK